jgi:hypothetical protein
LTAAMMPPPLTDNLVFEHCFTEISNRMPRLRTAVTQRDEITMRDLMRELRSTLGLLALPKLFELSQEIECRRVDFEPEVWQRDCHQFCDQLERIHYSLQQRLGRN